MALNLSTAFVDNDFEIDDEEEATPLMKYESVDATVKTVDKSVGPELYMKSVRTQYDPMDIPNPETRSKKSPGDILRVKVNLRQGRCKAVNTELSFPRKRMCNFLFPLATMTVIRMLTTTAMLTAICDDLPESSRQTENDPVYLPESQDSNTSEEESISTMETTPAIETTPVSEPKFLVFWTCLTSLFQFCSTCFREATITRVIKRGTLLIVHTTCPKKHLHKWHSQPIINGTGAGNMLLYAAILFSGNTFARISEMFNMLKMHLFSEPMYYQIQKSVLFPKLNTLYKHYRNYIYQTCTLMNGDNLIGDGRSDSRDIALNMELIL